MAAGKKPRTKWTLLGAALLAAAVGCRDENHAGVAQLSFVQNSASTSSSTASSPVIYPSPAGETSSALYDVQVVDQGVLRKSFVYTDAAREVTTPGNHGSDLQKGRSFNWTTFEIDKPTTVPMSCAWSACFQTPD